MVIDNHVDVEEASTTRDIASEGFNEKSKQTDNTENENIVDKAEEATRENEKEKHKDDEENIAEVESTANAERTKEGNANEEMVNTVAKKSSAIPDGIPVYCIATIENCPDSELNKEYCDSIRWFLVSEQHLAQNIISTELDYISFFVVLSDYSSKIG